MLSFFAVVHDEKSCLFPAGIALYQTFSSDATNEALILIGTAVPLPFREGFFLSGIRCQGPLRIPLARRKIIRGEQSLQGCHY